jgi:hypothetical protein
MVGGVVKAFLNFFFEVYGVDSEWKKRGELF